MRIENICNAAGMPIPTMDGAVPARELLDHNASGIYFGWFGGDCIYVGKSLNLGKRINGNGLLTPSLPVTVVHLDAADIHLGELFYIWLMEPLLNVETRMSRSNDMRHREQLKTDVLKAIREAHDASVGELAYLS